MGNICSCTTSTHLVSAFSSAARLEQELNDQQIRYRDPKARELKGFHRNTLFWFQIMREGEEEVNESEMQEISCSVRHAQ
jgi:hypothetical protein